MRVATVLLSLVWLAGCPAGDDDDATPEPLDLPADPAATGVPVGVRTVQHDGLTIEVWYPAPDAVAGEAPEAVELAAFVPDDVAALLGPIDLPPLASIAVRDAPLRVPEAPYPIVLFSHGFGGMRVQSVDITTHLASRGYVVAAVDHPGRMLGDVLPCVFVDPLDSCDLEGMLAGDPAPEQLEQALAWIDAAATEEGGWLAGAIDTNAVGLTGHSAGGVSTTALGDANGRFAALLPMASAEPVVRDVPTLMMGGSCDVTFEIERLEDAFTGTTDGTLVTIRGAGHLAFTDLCELELETFADVYLAPRDDVNPTFLASLVELATDGCAGVVLDDPPDEACADGYLALATSDPIVRHHATVWFDRWLRGSGAGVEDGVFPEVVIQ